MGIIKFNNVPSTTPGLEVETFPNYIAPEKEYQVTHVPGRNGDLVVDTKTYKNVPRSYKVSMAVEPPAVSVSGSTASFEATAERALAECKTVISSDVGKVGTTIINSTTDPVEDNEPYNFRAVPNGVGDRENDTLIGGTVAWNQNVDNGNFVTTTGWIAQTGTLNGVSNNVADVSFSDTNGQLVHNISLTNGHKFFSCVDVKIPNTTNKITFFGGSSNAFTYKNSTATTEWQTINLIWSTQPYSYVIIRNSYSGAVEHVLVRNCMIFDLTQMFGSTIADYIYSLEQATAGAGVAWFRNLFPKDYYAYNAGELISVKTEAHKMVGKNLFDPANYSSYLQTNGTYRADVTPLNNIKNYISEGLIGKEVTFSVYIDNSLEVSQATNVRARANINGTNIEGNNISQNSKGYSKVTFIPQSTNDYVYITYGSGGDRYVTFYNLMLELGNERTSYEPYKEWSYPLNPALELRGIPKLNSSNKLYYDGDIYSSDGSVIRKYGIVDLGTLSWSKDTTTRPADGATIHAWYATLSAARNSSDTAGFVGNLLVSGYKRTTTFIVDYGGRDTVDDKLVGGADTNHRIWLYNSAYSDYTGAQIRTALSGVYLIYELSAPVIESTSGLINNVSIASFDDGADDESVNSLVVDITAIESGSGEKSPDNPYTISGFDSGVVPRCGKNLFDNSLMVNSRTTVVGDTVILTATGNFQGSAFAFMPVKQGYKYALNIDSLTSGSGVEIRRYNASGTVTNTIVITQSTIINIADGTTVKISIVYGNRIAGAGTFVLKGFNIALGEEYQSYHAYNGNTYEFAFGQTVYGGHFDNKGNLVVTHGVVLDLGALSWIKGSKSFYANITGAKIYKQSVIPNMLCEIYEPVSYNDLASEQYNEVCSIDRSLSIILVRDTNYATVSDFTTAVSGKKAIFELANPITLAITSQDIPTILGENNIFANTGNIKSLSYLKQVCSFEPAQEVDDHGTEEYVDNREVAIPVGHESKYFTAGKIYNFSWLDEAGLIKKGELNADTGVLTITNGYGVVDLGSLTWTYASDVFYTDEITDKKVLASGSGSENLSNIYYTVIPSSTSVSNMSDMSIKGQVGAIRIYVKNSNYTDATTFKSAMHGVKLLYELADPVRTIQLTPVQVESLIGHNVLISESGNISVTPRTYSTYTEKMNAISDWLHSASGYARLEDTYEPDYYRKAYYDEQTDMENIFNEAGQATLNFICKPQRYLKSGEEPITISSGGLIQNRTRYEAYPILKVTTNNTQGSVAIGNHSITIKAGAGTDPITIDCELQDAWSGTSNKNSYIVLTDGEFPVIDPGTQTVTFDGGVQSVEVIPRWWTV